MTCGRTSHPYPLIHVLDPDYDPANDLEIPVEDKEISASVSEVIEQVERWFNGDSPAPLRVEVTHGFYEDLLQAADVIHRRRLAQQRLYEGEIGNFTGVPVVIVDGLAVPYRYVWPRTDCPDGGKCHHRCEVECWRVRNAAPLAGVYPNDEWPPEWALWRPGER